MKLLPYGAALLLALCLAACGPGGSEAGIKSDTGTTGDRGVLKKLNIIDVKPGEGDGAKDGDLLLLQFKGTFRNGTTFDTNMTAGKQPYSVFLGTGAVIPGWDQGLVGMKKGGVRKLEIPYSLAYGEQGNITIPGKTDLFFEIHLLDLVKGDELNIVDKEDIKVGTGPEVKAGSTVTMHAIGTLADGQVFESTRDNGEPVTFKMGANEAYPWIEVGVRGMRQGGKRRVRIPPGAAYGGNQVDVRIPPYSILYYEFDVSKVR